VTLRNKVIKECWAGESTPFKAEVIAALENEHSAALAACYVHAFPEASGQSGRLIHPAHLTEPNLPVGYFQPSGRVVRAPGTRPINMLMHPALPVMHALGVLRNEGLLSVSPRLTI
jgi:hypothetical protein